MQAEGTAKQIARWVALGALFLIPLTPLIVLDSYFFPFITGKAFYFRILVEIAVAAWIVLALLDKEYRPRFSWVGVAVLSFVAWMFIADLFAMNVVKAFWSNFERMEGWVLLVHLLGFFFASSAVLRVDLRAGKAGKKWRAWFLASIGVSLAISVYAFMQLGGVLAIHQGSTRIDASLGNSAYLAIYLLFNVFIALWLAFTEERAWIKWSLVVVAVVETVLIFFTETRGTIIGLIGALSLASLLLAITAGKRVRRRAIGMLVILLISVGGFYLARNSSFVQSNHTLQRIASISLADGQTRFTIWHMAFQGVLERPLTGWGQEGFNYVFNKYYDPSLYQQELWFDRAHNAFIDWLSAGGIPAFLLYLSLFGSALVFLWKSSELSRIERIALTAALVGYACHNLFVFDNLYSYIYFFAILALIDSQVSRPVARLEHYQELSAGSGMTYAIPFAVVLTVAVVWWVNISGMRVATGLITAISPSTGGASTRLDIFEDLLKRKPFAIQEVREQLISFAASAVQSSQTTNEEKKRAVSLAITEMQKQVNDYPLDARERLQLAYIYRVSGDGENALKEIQMAKTLSPKKEAIWIESGVSEWGVGNMKAAQADFNMAYKLGHEFPELATYAAAGEMVVGNQAAADQILIDAYGTTTVDSDVLAVAYYQMKNWPRLIALWKLRTSRSNANAETWFGLASAYYAAGENANSISTINMAVKLFPQAASAGEAAIKQINGTPAGQ